MLWNIFGPKRKKVTLEWRTSHSEECHSFTASSKIMKVIKSKDETDGT